MPIETSTQSFLQIHSDFYSEVRKLSGDSEIKEYDFPVIAYSSNPVNPKRIFGFSGRTKLFAHDIEKAFYSHECSIHAVPLERRIGIINRMRRELT